MSENVIRFPERRDEVPETLALEVRIYQNGRVSTWVDDEVTTKEQFNWLFCMLMFSGQMLDEVKRERTDVGPIGA